MSVRPATQDAWITEGQTVRTEPGTELKATRFRPPSGTFKIMHDNALIRAAHEAREALPTLFIIMSLVEQQNFVRLRTANLAELLGVSIPTTERHLAKLKKLKLLEPDPFEADKKANIVCWRVCPWLSWKGSSADIPGYLKDFPEDHPWRVYNKPIEWVENKPQLLPFRSK